jgi:hypothetical protein
LENGNPFSFSFFRYQKKSVRNRLPENLFYAALSYQVLLIVKSSRGREREREREREKEIERGRLKIKEIKERV